MPVFTTSSGDINVKNWGYLLQQPNGLDAGEVALMKHDLIVIDYSSDGTGANKFSAQEIADIKDGPGGKTVAVSYISIGEASEFRDHWDSSWTQDGLADSELTEQAPDWLGPTNPDWPESRKVRYWDDEWQDHIFNESGTGWLDDIVSQGFDGAYLDIIDAYYYWAVELPDAQRQPGDPAKNDEMEAAKRMIDFIVDMTAHARLTNPNFFVIMQNGDFLMDALEGTDPERKAALLDAIGAIAVEDVFFDGDKDENNAFNPTEYRLDILKEDYLENGIPVFSVDYLSKPSKVEKFEQAAIEAGFIPYAAPSRELDVIGDQLGGGKGTSENDLMSGSNGKNELYGKAGSDILQGFAGADILKGGKGTDWLFGDKGKDKLYGGKSDDYLTGGKGKDKFVFDKKSGTDTILDFVDGKDKIHLKKFGFSSKSEALSKFKEMGGASNDKVKFKYQGTEIIIKGADLADISGQDIII